MSMDDKLHGINSAVVAWLIRVSNYTVIIYIYVRICMQEHLGGWCPRHTCLMKEVHTRPHAHHVNSA
eukprot:scaffold582292_cov33-Prasinocladus_malaysianus.AAC.1